jgi:hypothetical protein
MNKFHKEGKLNEYRTVSLKLNEFNTLYRNFVVYTKKEKPMQALRETLSLFCFANPVTDLKEVVRVFESSDY